MIKRITLRDRDIAYTLRMSRRSRSVRLSVSADGAVTLSTPLFLSAALAERFLHEKADWLLSKLDDFKQRPARPMARYGRREFLIHRGAAYELILARIKALNERYGFRHSSVSIRNQKTRWGSCSRSGKLNFNFRIYFLPERLRDYVIVHELCHLKELNHSKRFWNLVAHTFPDHKKIRQELRMHSYA